MSIENELREALTRRHFFGKSATGLGIAALGSLLASDAYGATGDASQFGGLAGLPHFPPKAKRVVYLHQSGGPSQLDLFDYKPGLKKYQGTDLPASVRQGQRITGMTSGQATLPVASSVFDFKQYGQSGAWISELLPHTAKIVDQIAIVKTFWTDAINHDPAITFIQSGFQQPGRPSMGAWVNYGLGSENRELPAFVVLISQQSALNTDQPLFSRLWGSGFLPSKYQGVQFRSSGDPVLYLSNPPGIEADTRRDILDAVKALNEARAETFHDPEIEARIAQYEMAYKMQTSVPELTDLSKEPESTFELYGPDSRRAGTYASHCLLARRMLERNVRFVQIYKRGWDQHNDLPRDLALQSRSVDQPSAALVTDLKQRGLLDDTLVIWGGEFGRTVYCQGKLTETNYGRDHHPRCFTVLLAGAGVKAGLTYGQTDDYCYNIVDGPIHIHDLNATIMHLLGVDHTKLTYRYQGRDFRLTDIHGELAKGLLA